MGMMNLKYLSSQNLTVDVFGLAGHRHALSWNRNHISGQHGKRWPWYRYRHIFPLHHRDVK